jgi:hypothetical protein
MYLLHTKGNNFKIFLEDISKTDVICARNLCIISRRTSSQNFGLGRGKRWTVALFEREGTNKLRCWMPDENPAILSQFLHWIFGEHTIGETQMVFEAAVEGSMGVGWGYKMDGRVV